MKILSFSTLLLIALASNSAGDVVVLSTGERLDVESYEIQAQVVVVKTWDGRLRALPRAYVDIEATEIANDAPKPEQEIAPERLAKARKVCEDYGIQNAVSTYRVILDKQMQKLRGRMSIRRYDLLRAAFRNAFDDERTFNAVVTLFAENANLDLLDAWSAWLATPLARRMIAMETTELSTQESERASRYYIELQSNAEAYEHRLEIMGRLDEARSTTESGIEVVLHLVEAFFEAGRTIFPDEEIEYDAEEIRLQLAPIMKEASLSELLIMFREASDEELEEFIAYWNTEDGQRVVRLMNNAVETSARQGSEVAMQMVAGKRHTVP